MLKNVSTNIHFLGFSFSDKMPTSHEEVADNLYEFLQQWFQLFPEYQVSLEHTDLYKTILVFIKICRVTPFIHLENPMVESGFLTLQGRFMKRIKMELTTFSKLTKRN